MAPSKARGGRRRRNNLPPRDDPHYVGGPAASIFLGRERELTELAGLLERERLLTLTGAPGIGKSRLALELGGMVGERFDGGWQVVELAAVARPVGVLRAVAAALSIEEVPGERLTDTVVARLSNRRLLLVLDDCEHVVGACAELVAALLAGCSELRLLATSREPLGAVGEVVWQVPTLAAPAEETSPDGLMDYPAVALFVEHAAIVKPGFSLNAYVAPAVAEITRRLDGIPLAIELAAARVESLTPEEVAGRLDDRFALLRNPRGSGLSHHQTLQQALEWSHELLSEPERVLLRRLSVFAGGFELRAAEAVCVGECIDGGEVADLLLRLVAKSLVLAEAGSSAMPRYRLLETIRAYAGDQLEGAGEVAALRSAHARFYLSLTELAEPQLTGPEQERWLERLSSERANLRQALDWSLGQGQAEQAQRLAGALVLFWRVRCHFSEGRELLDAAISADRGGPTGLRAKALWGAGFLALMVGDLEDAIARVEDSLALYEDLNDLQGCARALLILGNVRQLREEPEALSLLEQSAALARKAGDHWCLAHALGVAGFEYSHREEFGTARPLLEECLAVTRQAQDCQGLRMGLLGLGLVCVQQGDYQSAESILEEAVTVSAQLGEAYAKATALQYLGQLAIGRGEYGRARQLLRDAKIIIREVGPPAAMLESLVPLGQVAHADGNRGDARSFFEEALAVAHAGNGTSLHALLGLAELSAEEGNRARARRLFEEVLDRARNVGKSARAQAVEGLGRLALADGEAKRAAVLVTEALELRRETRSLPEIIASLESIAEVGAEGGSYELAAQLLGAAQGRRGENGYTRPPWAESRYEGTLSSVREGLSDTRFRAALDQGARMSIEQAEVLASKDVGPRGRPSSGWQSLTDSERRVVAVAAEGLTNPQIAERLFISLGTVKAHLSKSFSKLGVGGRRELARELRRHEGESSAATHRQQRERGEGGGPHPPP